MSLGLSTGFYEVRSILSKIVYFFIIIVVTVFFCMASIEFVSIVLVKG